jgi:serine/threonine protein kinase
MMNVVEENTPKKSEYEFINSLGESVCLCKSSTDELVVAKYAKRNENILRKEISLIHLFNKKQLMIQTETNHENKNEVINSSELEKNNYNDNRSKVKKGCCLSFKKFMKNMYNVLCFYICCFCNDENDKDDKDAQDKNYLKHMNQGETIDSKIIKINNEDFDSGFFPELYDIKTSPKRYYLITKYVGDDLLKYLTDNDSIGEITIKIIFKQIVISTKMMHGIGIAHGDMSLENICIYNKKNIPMIKLIDFELSLIHPQSPYAKILSSGYKIVSPGNKMENQTERAIIHLQDNKTEISMYPIYQTELKTSLKKYPGHTDAYGKLRTVSPERYQSHLSTENFYCSYKDDIYALGIILFVLFFRSYPYCTPVDTDKNFESIISGEWVNNYVRKDKKRLDTNYQHVSISADAADMIDRILKPEKDRFSIDDILDHRWMKTVTL